MRPPSRSPLGVAACAACWSVAATAAAGLIPGDVVLLGLNADNPDEFAWAPLVDLAPGTQLWFTDAGWLGGQYSGAAGASRDGLVRFTAPPEGVPAGRILSVRLDQAPAYQRVSDSRFGPSFSLSPSGDQLAVLAGPLASPTPLFGLTTRADQWITPATPSANLDSELYAGLTDGWTALAAGAGPNPGDEYDNVRYAGPISGTRDALLRAIADAGYWEGRGAPGAGDRFDSLSRGVSSLQIQSAAAPEPSGLALCLAAVVVSAGCGRWRRRRLSHLLG